MVSVAGIRILALDPDLAAPLPSGERTLAERTVVVPSVRVPTGAWDPAELGDPRYGVLLVDGLVAREATVAGTAAVELLGTGDLMQPCGVAPEELIATTADWIALEPLHVAVLDDHFGHALRRWPELARCLLARSEQRAARLAVYQAISHLNRVDDRVLVMLWTLAGRWGRVTGDGVTLPLRLTHRTIARMVGARRPSVTTAITQLCARDLVARRGDGSWMLHGAPPHELEHLAVDRMLPAPAPPPARRPERAMHLEPPIFVDLPAADRKRATLAQITTLVDAYEARTD